MNTILVNDLLKLNTLDFMMDVHIHGTVHEWEPTDAPMIRKVKRVYIKNEKEKKQWLKNAPIKNGKVKQWLYWEWEKNHNENFTRGYSDCGYSGICLESEDINKLYFKLDN